MLAGRQLARPSIDTTDGVRLQVSFGEETTLIYPWLIVIEAL